MSFLQIFQFVRKWITVTSGAFATGGFWGLVAATLVQYGFDVSEMDSMLYVGLPVAVFMAIFMWRRLPKLLGFEN